MTERLLWPEPDEETGDGSDFGESEDNDGTPGAAGSHASLRAAYDSRKRLTTANVLRAPRAVAGLVKAMMADPDSTTSHLPRRLRTVAYRAVGLGSVWPVIPSKNYSSRKGARPRLGLFHTAEGARTRASLGSFFQQATNVSSHTGIDDTGITRYVPDAYSAWTASKANPVSVQTELCAFAAWTPAEWARHPGMLENAAQWAAAVHMTHGIPLVRLQGTQTVNGTGFAMHHDITVGWKTGSHTDCGKYFPIDTVLARARQIIASEEDDMFEQADREMLKRVNDELTKKIGSRVPGARPEDADTLFGTALNADKAAVDAARHGEFLRSDAFLNAVADRVVARLLAEELDVPTWVADTGEVKTMKVRVRESIARAAEASPVRHLLMGKSTPKA